MPMRSVAQIRESASSRLLPVLTAVVVIAALYFFKEMLIPFVLALLISFLLTPPVTWLEKLKFGRVPSVVLVMAIAFSFAAALAWMGTEELTEIIAELPSYRANIGLKIDTLGTPGTSRIGKAASAIEQLRTQISAASAKSQATQKAHQRLNAERRAAGEPEVPTPVPVEIVHQEHTGVLGSLGLVSSSLAHVLGEAGAVVVFTLFMLINRGHIRNRALRLFGEGHLVTMTTALDDAARRVSRYLLTQSAVNGMFGTLLGVGLYLIGVPFAPFWGVLGGLLRFIPYVGTLIAGACPFVLSLAVFQGWERPLFVLAIFAGIEFTTSGAIEPWLYATRTGISSLAILISATFWALLWGPVGLLLSTPLTVCLAVLGRHIPQLEFLHVLLGDEPVLDADVRYYQRLLAGDEDEAAEIAEEVYREKSLVEAYDSVIVPALQMAQRDRERRHLDDERTRFIYQATRELIEDLGSRSVADDIAAEIHPEPAGSLLCLPARNDADELVALMLIQLARRHGYDTEILSASLGEERFTRIRQSHAGTIVISALPPSAVIRARSLCRRARQERKDAKVIVGLWNSVLPAEKIAERLKSICSDSIVVSLAELEAELGGPAVLAGDRAQALPAT
jgi:predicted PurR-regulated permease PerM